ncbi:MAG: hypothetical protein GY835_05780 [bacterium]|nr:hypothetical protein [bacterium]
MSSIQPALPNPKWEISPFVFIGEAIRLEEGLRMPLEVSPNAFLEKAEGKYVEAIKSRLYGNFLSRGIDGRYFSIHEQKCIPNEDGNGNRSCAVGPDEWEYWIVRQTNFRRDEKLEVSIELSDARLTPLFSAFGSHGRSGKLIPEVPDVYYQHRLSTDKILVTKCILENLKEVRGLLDSFDESKRIEYGFLDKALSDFLRLKELSTRSPFRVVCIFTVLEILMTSNITGRSDRSITHQLKTKIPLLNNLLSKPLSFSDYFKGPDGLTDQKIVEKLYSYRSSIAHGSLADFDSELQVLGSEEVANKFLYELTRNLLIYSLKVPHLIHDLRYC